MTHAPAGPEDRDLDSLFRRALWICPLTACLPFALAWALGDQRLESPYNAMLVLTLGYSAGLAGVWWRRRRAPTLRFDPADLFVVTVLFFASILAFLTLPSFDYRRIMEAPSERWLAGDAVYAINGTTHPPTLMIVAATIMRLLVMTSPDPARLPAGGVWNTVYLLHQLGQLMLLAWLFVLAYRLSRRVGASPLAAGVLTAVLLMAAHPLRDALGHNQPSVLVLVLGMASLDCLQRRPVLAGILGSAGALVKLYPAVLGLEWIVARRLRTLAAAAIVALLVIGPSFPLWVDWLGYLQSFRGISSYRDAGIHGNLVNLFVAAGGGVGLAVPTRVALARGVWVIVVIAIAWWAVGRTRAAHRYGEDPATGVGPELLAASVLCFPLAWSHHYIFVLPLAIARLSGASVRGGDAAGVLLALIAPAADVFLLGLHRIAGVALLLWLPLERGAQPGENRTSPSA